MTIQNIHGQEELENKLNLLIEDFIEGQENTSSFELIDLYDLVYELAQNPIDINRATAKQLGRIFILTNVDANKVINHRNQYGDFVDINELQAIEGINRSTLRLLSKLSYVGNSDIKPLAEVEARSEMIIKLRRDLENRRGFKPIDGEEPRYAGDPNYYLFRINRRNDHKLSYNFTLEKDAGESLSHRPVAFDFFSGYLHKKDLSNHLHSVTLGDYSIRMGEGLMLNNGFSFGKSISTINIKAGGYQVKPYTSTQENLAFRGMAAEWSVGPLQILNFISYRQLDANQTTNNLDEPIVSSLQTSGLHRTEGEIFDKDAIDDLSAGISLTINPTPYIDIGLNGLTHNISVPLVRTNQPYNQFRFGGDQYFGGSLDYSALIKGMQFFGEVAISDSGGLAQSHGVMTSLSKNFDIALHFRDFDRDFQALHSNTFSESRRSENEIGQYLGVEYRPSEQWTINAYADFWRHPWLRFRVDAPSDGTEYLLRTTFNKRRKRTIYFQYRYERKQENSSINSTLEDIVDKSIHRLRLQMNEKLSPYLELRTRWEGSHFIKESDIQHGWTLYQDVLYQGTDSPIKLAARVMYFNVDDFESRIYAYESDIRYEFSIPFFSGKGFRYYLRASYRLPNRVIIESRLSQTNYIDGREEISSGNNEIEGSKLTQFKLQLRYLF